MSSLGTRPTAIAACLVAAVGLSPGSTVQRVLPNQPDFVADLVITVEKRVERGRIAHRRGAWRVDVPVDSSGPLFVYLFRGDGTVVVMAPDGEYAESEDEGFERLLAPWLWLGEIAASGARIEPAGAAEVDGRLCEKLLLARGDASGDPAVALFVARDLAGLVVRFELPDVGGERLLADTYELRNVTLGAPEELFRVPDGARAVDDVDPYDWVTPDFSLDLAKVSCAASDGGSTYRVMLGDEVTATLREHGRLGEDDPLEVAALLVPADGGDPIPVPMRRVPSNEDHTIIFRATFRAEPAGEYEYRVTVRGKSPTGVAFEKTDSKRLVVAAPRARVSGVEPHVTVDSDRDGRIDAIELRPRVELLGPGEVIVIAEVTGPNGKVVRADAKVSASGVVPVRVDASRIVEGLGVDGPYMARVGLTDELFAPTIFGDAAPERLDYRMDQFDGTGLEIVGVGTVRGVDLNGNGIFEVIEIPVEVRVGRRGHYTATACIWADGSGMSGIGVGEAPLDPGRGTLILKFNAYIVREEVAGRPYSLGCLAVYGEGEGTIAGRNYPLVQISMDRLEARTGDTLPPRVDVRVEPSVVRATGGLVEVRVIGLVWDERELELEGRVCWVEGGAERVGGDRLMTRDVEVHTGGRVLVRAELAEGAADRVYTIGFCAQDLAGNVATGTATVRVVR